MDLQSIQILKLFGQFDYTISLNREQGITILTGPNGYGKTTILKIIYHFFKQNLFFFQKLNFKSITFFLSDNKNILITKERNDLAYQPLFDIDEENDIDDDDDELQILLRKSSFIDIFLTLKLGDNIIEEFTFNYEIAKKLWQDILNFYPEIRRMTRYRSFDIEDYIFQIPQKPLELINGFSKSKKQLFSVLINVDVHLIDAQRLLKPNINPGRYDYPMNNIRPFSYTIQSYATELLKLINQKQAEAFQVSQNLDNTFPSRLIQNTKTLSAEEFNYRFNALTEKQQQLQQFGITVSNIQVPEYKQDKADVLSVYLDDSEEKTNFFDDLVNKINLFVSIINEKKFAHKKLHINGNSGFYFKTDQDKELNLTALSSGEQEEVVLLYELLFRTHRNTLVLIDEPEISLHVSWQKAFIDDLLAIAKNQHISLLVATHSPQVINGNWDMTTDLYELANGKVYSENE
jgi:predicted ATP-binding protein involved in virulence